MLKRAAFLDRDGVIIKDKGYISHPDQVELFKGAAEAIARLNRSQILVIVVTNQSGIARGYFNIEDMNKVNTKMKELLQAGGAHLNGLYYCPHHPEGVLPEYTQVCRCRKPQTGLLTKAADDFGIDLKDSYMIGDNISDMEAGRIVGCQTILISDNHDALNEYKGIKANDLKEAVSYIFEEGAGYG